MATEPKRVRRGAVVAAPARPVPLVYTVADAAKLMRVSETSIREWLAEGTIPHVRKGRLIRIPAAQFHRWLDSIGAAS